MPRYVLLMRNDAMGATLMLHAGADGAKTQREVLEVFGAKVECQCAVMGAYDAVIVADFPSAGACAAFAQDANRSGQYVEQLVALTKADLGEARERVRTAAKILLPIDEKASE